MHIAGVLGLAFALGTPVWAAEGPSFDCGQAVSGAEKAVCDSPVLSALDRVLAEVYGWVRSSEGAPSTLSATQQDWIKGRDECWTTPEPAVCVKREYVERIAELVAEVPGSGGDAPVVGPIAVTCEGIADPIQVVFVNTDPNFVALRWGDMSIVLDQAISASGARYESEVDGGRYEFWEKGGDANFSGPSLMAPAHCTLRP